MRSMNPQRPVFLIVDDDPTTRDFISYVLQHAFNAVTVEAGTNAQAFAALAESPIDLIVSDMFRHEGSGLEFVQALRRDDSSRNLPIVVVSGGIKNEHELDL